jgi:hypothetical protein
MQGITKLDRIAGRPLIDKTRIIYYVLPNITYKPVWNLQYGQVWSSRSEAAFLSYHWGVKLKQLYYLTT